MTSTDDNLASVNTSDNPDSADISDRTSSVDTSDEKEPFSTTEYVQLGGDRRPPSIALTAFQKIQRAFFTDQEPKTLEPHLWRAYLSAIHCEIGRLLRLEHEWDRWPHVDRHVFESGKIRLVGIDGRLGDPLLEHVRENWSYNYPPISGASIKRYRRARPFVAVDWSDFNLACQGPEFKICKRSDLGTSSDEGLHTLSERISSQLLLYRTTLVFGIPPQLEEIDGYKCCWAAELYHKDGSSTLGLYDQKRSVSVHYDGTSNNKAEALDVLNHLCGDYISHTDGGVVIGAQA